MRDATRCVRLDDDADPYSASMPPLYQTATFRQAAADELGPYDYTRSDNPTRHLLEAKIAELEGVGDRGGALAYASGMAACAALLRLLRPGDEIVAGDDLYGGTSRLLAQVAPGQGLATRFVDLSQPARVEEALGPRTRLLFVETPSNPRLRIAPIAELARTARSRGILTAVDNSLLTPLGQRPLALGADLVLHSATKALGGHGDLTAGLVATGDSELLERLAFLRNAEGNALAPFEAWLLLRGLKTLALRVERQERSALRIAEFLDDHPAVIEAFHPGLPRHRHRAVHQRQARGNGPLVSFTVGDPRRARALIESLRLFAIAVSFGSVASAATLPGRMSHASVPEELRSRLAPPDDLIRLSVGIEDPDDLLDDLGRALAEICAVRPLPRTAECGKVEA